MLTTVFYMPVLRWLIPAVFMLGTAPNFLTLWACWRLLTLPLPTGVYEFGDDIWYSFYQKLILFFFENYTGVEVIMYGDAAEIFRKKENVILLCNHQCTVDWVVANVLAVRQGSIGHIRYILKDGLKYFPLYGFYFRQHSCIYVERSGKFKENKAVKQLETLAKSKIPFWMVLFPEGTRYNPNLPEVIKKSKEFAKKHGLKELNYLLTPRSRGLQLCVERLRANTDAVYDVTIGYAGTKDPTTNQRRASPGLPEFLQGDCKQLHLLVKRIEMKDIPSGEEELGAWLNQRYQEKDKLMERFYSDNPHLSETLGNDGRRSQLSLKYTLPIFLFWVGVNLPIWATEMGRSYYWKASLLSTLAGWAWMTIRS